MDMLLRITNALCFHVLLIHMLKGTSATTTPPPTFSVKPAHAPGDEPPDADDKASDSSPWNSPAVLAGIVVGGVIVLAAIVSITVIIVRKSRSHSSTPQPGAQASVRSHPEEAPPPYELSTADDPGDKTEAPPPYKSRRYDKNSRPPPLRAVTPTAPLDDEERTHPSSAAVAGPSRLLSVESRDGKGTNEVRRSHTLPAHVRENVELVRQLSDQSVETNGPGDEDRSADEDAEVPPVEESAARRNKKKNQKKNTNTKDSENTNKETKNTRSNENRPTTENDRSNRTDQAKACNSNTLDDALSTAVDRSGISVRPNEVARERSFREDHAGMEEQFHTPHGNEHSRLDFSDNRDDNATDEEN